MALVTGSALLVGLGALLGSMIKSIGMMIVKSVAGKAYLIGPLLAVMAAFYAAMSGFVALVEVVSPPWLAEGVSLFIPYNLKFCVSLVWSARVTATIYEHWREFVLAGNQFRGE